MGVVPKRGVSQSLEWRIRRRNSRLWACRIGLGSRTL